MYHRYCAPTMAVIVALAVALLSDIVCAQSATTIGPPQSTTVGPSIPGVAALQTLQQTLSQILSQLAGTYCIFIIDTVRDELHK